MTLAVSVAKLVIARSCSSVCPGQRQWVRHEPSSALRCQQPASPHRSALPWTMSVRSRKISLSPLVTVKTETKIVHSHGKFVWKRTQVSRICPSFFFHILAYFVSFLKESLKEGKMMVNCFFLCWYPASRSAVPVAPRRGEYKNQKHK